MWDGSDDQVKIRGFRIELGEIEAQLQKVEGIRKTTVFARENVSGEKQLCAYYEADCELPAAELKSVLSQELPAYMIPSYLIQLERMPLTTNGKVDRRSLPAPEESLQPGEGVYCRLGLALGSQLAEIWKSVLGLEHIGVHGQLL